MTKRTKIEDIKRQEGIKEGKNKREPIFGFALFIYSLWISNYTVHDIAIQLKYGTTKNNGRKNSCLMLLSQEGKYFQTLALSNDEKYHLKSLTFISLSSFPLILGMT